MDSLCFISLFIWQMLLPMIFGQLDVIGRCYCHVAFLSLQLIFFVFDWCCSQLLVFFMADGDVVVIWLMFVLADVIAICFCGCWYYHFDHQLYQKVCHCYFLLADVIARMADGIAMYMIGRCYCYVADVVATVVFFVLLADIIAWRLMFLPLLCSVLLADVVSWWLIECLP